MDSNTTPTQELVSLEITTKIYSDPESVTNASKDFGNIIHCKPTFVFRPSTETNIASLVKLSYGCSRPFPIAARGQAHSTWGQTMAENGIVIDTSALTNKGPRLRVSHSPSLGHFADVGGEQLWKDVLEATVGLGVGPTSWTDYLYLTVGGTLSCAGISGQTPFYGPQISHVLEMDVVTGRGELVTCSKEVNSELFEAALGGLGQFGIITRARLALDTSPEMVKWARLMYTDFSCFTKDQEHLISLNNGVNYIEGSPFLSRSGPVNWRSSTFYSPAEKEKIDGLIVQHDTIYCLELGIYYDRRNADQANEDFESLVKGLGFCPGFRYVKDVTWAEFLDRVRSQGEAVEDTAKGLAHPWLLLFVPGSRISDFNKGVFLDIVVNQEKEIGPVLIYPMNRNKWDEKMSAVVPNEEVFYSVSFLHTCRTDEWEQINEVNNKILKFCEDEGIEIKQYIPHYEAQQEWEKHFGPKWKVFQERKAQFDPKMILSPGQRIFNTSTENSRVFEG